MHNIHNERGDPRPESLQPTVNRHKSSPAALPRRGFHLIYINHQTGLVEPGKRVRTRKKALEALYEEFFKHLDTRKIPRVAVLHGDARRDAEVMAERIRREYAPAELLVNVTGPRAIALVGYTED